MIEIIEYTAYKIRLFMFFRKAIESVHKQSQQQVSTEVIVFANVHRKMLGAIRQWFENTRFPAGPELIPVRVRIVGSAHHRPMSSRECRVLKRR